MSGSYDQTLKLWNVEDGNVICTFEGHTDAGHQGPSRQSRLRNTLDSDNTSVSSGPAGEGQALVSHLSP